MKASLVFASVLLAGTVSQAAPRTKAEPKTQPKAEQALPTALECSYEATHTRTGADLGSVPALTLPITDQEAGATSRLPIGKFATFNAYAWQLNGNIVIAAEEQTSKAFFSSTGSEKANLRLQTNEGIFETFCKIIR